MDGLVRILLLCLLPGVGTFAGGVLALWTRPPGWFVGVALHGAAGIAIAVVSLELMPRAIADGETPWLVLAFVGGAAFSIVLSLLVGRMIDKPSGALMVVVATAVDLATDGLMTGVGSSIAAGLGLLLAVSQVLGNVPNGFAATANLGDRLSGGKRLALLAALPLVALVGGVAGFLALRDADPAIQSAALAFMAGVLLLATIEDTVSQGDEPQPPRRYSSLAFAGGFALMMVITEVVSA